MASVVVLYDELFADVLGESIKICKRIWEDMGYEAVEMEVRENISPDIYMNRLADIKPDFLLTFAMAGFVWRGLMGQVRFNTLSVMQIHILIGNFPHYDFFLRKEYGINSFFFTDSQDIYDNWKDKYPQISFLDSIPLIPLTERLSEEEKYHNISIFQTIIQKVKEFIENPFVL